MWARKLTKEINTVDCLGLLKGECEQKTIYRCSSRLAAELLCYLILLGKLNYWVALTFFGFSFVSVMHKGSKGHFVELMTNWGTKLAKCYDNKMKIEEFLNIGSQWLRWISVSSLSFILINARTTNLWAKRLGLVLHLVVYKFSFLSTLYDIKINSIFFPKKKLYF